jgi:hypothetical protein
VILIEVLYLFKASVFIKEEKMNNKSILSIINAGLLTFSLSCNAAQFTFDENVEGGAGGSYIGPGVDFSFLGGVLDGGRDAFDGYGGVTNLGGLEFSRHTDALTGLNTFRFLDTFTNNTNQAISTTVRFYGNLGSDTNGSVVFDHEFFMTTCQFAGACVGDPVISHVFGNNAFTQNNISASFTTSNILGYNIDTMLTLAPGESAGLLFFAFLASEETGTNHSLDGPLAVSIGASLVANPILTGLTQSEIDSIVNYSVVPLPSSVWLFGSGLIGLIGLVRRKNKV